MPVLTLPQALEKLAAAVERAQACDLPQISAELFPQLIDPPNYSAGELAEHVRRGLEAEEIVDLWNVVLPADRNVWYDEELSEIRFNEEVPDPADVD
jgi:predicted phage gp36 major capsid-like protein